jgi:hypothetical protein
MGFITPAPPWTDSQNNAALVPPSTHTLPSFITPLHGPTHTCLCGKLLRCYLNSTDCEAEAADTSQAYASNTNDVDEVPETTFNSPSMSQNMTCASSLLQPSSNPNTYSGCCAHLLSGLKATVTNPANTNNAPNILIRPDSPSLTPAQLIWREHAQAAATKVHAEMAKLALHHCPGIFASASQPPASRSQPHLPLRVAMSHGPQTWNHTCGHRSMCQMAWQNQLVACVLLNIWGTGPCPTCGIHESMGLVDCAVARVCSQKQVLLCTPKFCDHKRHHKCLLKSLKYVHKLEVSEYVFSIFSINELAVCVQKYSPGIAWGVLGALLYATREGPHRIGHSAAHSMRNS